MSWCDRRAALALLAVLPLAGCGFHPLYGERSALFDEDPALAAVEVPMVPERVGQILTQTVREQLNPRGDKVKPLYVLRVVLAMSRNNLGIRRDNTSTRGELVISATVALVKSGGQKPVYEETIRSFTAFNLPDDAYAATVAEDSARERAAGDLGRDIAQRVAVFLKRERAKDADARGGA